MTGRISTSLEKARATGRSLTRYARRLLLPLGIAAGLAGLGTVATLAKFTKDESFKGAVYHPYVPEVRPLIKNVLPLPETLSKLTAQGALSESDLYNLADRAHQQLYEMRDKTGRLTNDDADSLVKIARAIDQANTQHLDADNQWLAVITRIKIAETLFLSLKGESFYSPKCGPYIDLAMDIASQNYGRLAAFPRSAEILGLKRIDDPRLIPVIINDILYAALHLSETRPLPICEKEGNSPDRFGQFDEYVRGIIFRGDGGADMTLEEQKDIALTYLEQRMRNGYWYKGKAQAANRYYQELVGGRLVRIDIENLKIVSTARKALRKKVPLFKESCAAHECPPTLLATIALYNNLFKARFPVYRVADGLSIFSSSTSEASLASKAAKWARGKWSEPLKGIAFQDRFTDFISGVFLGACGTTGLMQVRACPLQFQHIKNIREDDLWGRLAAPADDWSNQRINYALYFKDKYSIEAGAALWGQMLKRLEQIELAGQPQSVSLPKMAHFKNGNWRLNYSPDQSFFGPDFFSSLFEATYGRFHSGEYLYSGLIDPPKADVPAYATDYIDPATYLFNVYFLPNARPFSALHRVILQSGLFRAGKGLFVGLTRINQLEQLDKALLSGDEYLAKAAERTICAISADASHPQFKEKAIAIRENRNLACNFSIE
ncbi:MAG: hypothetical protein JW873_04930 [Candidatus Saganbacteria bacterium]|nr:hypothetical protein [Candidatus Saganbacteria bacterium]